MNNNQLSEKLIESMADLNLDETLSLVNHRITKDHNPLSIVEDCQVGLQIVGERYEQKEYYLSGLIMAGEIFRKVMELLLPIIEQQVTGNETGNVLLATVQGDIHDIGKNNLSMLLRCYGFTVNDLGVNVPPEKIMTEASEKVPDIIGLSGLLSITRETMRETVTLIRSFPNPQIAKIPIIIGGGLLNNQICEYVGANSWATDAMSGVRLCQQLITR
jgi:methanogenic corrinoid protein MtbC1